MYIFLWGAATRQDTYTHSYTPNPGVPYHKYMVFFAVQCLLFILHGMPHQHTCPIQVSVYKK